MVSIQGDRFCVLGAAGKNEFSNSEGKHWAYRLFARRVGPLLIRAISPNDSSLRIMTRASKYKNQVTIA
jgi:hypothetical protein